MKKIYETPSVEVVKFQYRDQVVAESTNTGCHTEYDKQGGCEQVGWIGNLS